MLKTLSLHTFISILLLKVQRPLANIYIYYSFEQLCPRLISPLVHRTSTAKNLYELLTASKRGS